MKQISKLLLTAIAPALLLAACGGGSDDNINDRLDTADPQIRFVHAVPLSPDVALYRNGTLVREVNGVNYKFASEYLNFDTGATDLVLKNSSSGAQVGDNVPFDADRGHKYTLVALPAVASTELMLIDDPYDKGLLSDKARVRVLHAAFNSGKVDVYLTGVDQDITQVGPRFSAVEYKQAQPASGSDSLGLDGGTYRLRITTAGTKNVIFNTTVKLDDNADWLLTAIPSGGVGTVVPNSLKVLLVKANDGSKTTQELTSED
ncbi:DUF4397 domain-containing protein [Aquabacterium sp. A7-Y]|uniref:DUF4397 domain-containing protein n=1 Tax=Aquabacterium sp. A7-Y TaxID=1349605 RepID=UPI00223CF552|nr:DUF4397 domain-containing protein [Aquabacterium sp. A7-Y]MCW7539257.1 DUF4397 domain-containing protein [Aquabacterium sp. A7-Y]